MIVLITAILLILAICTTRKDRILNPDVIFNPVIILRIVGFLLVVAGVASVCEMYDSVVFALFILAGDTDRNSKESVLLGIFQMPRLFLIALAVEAIVWTGLSLIVNTVGRKKTMTGQHTGARDGGTTAHDP